MENPIQDMLSAQQRLPGDTLIAKSPIMVVFKGRRMRAVWSRVWMRPVHETDHEFYLALLRRALGLDWLRVEESKPESQRHRIAAWFEEMDRERESSRPRSGAAHVWSSEPTGGVTELLTLGRDLYDLSQTNQLPTKVMDRLRNTREYQGARYEIAVAGAFARAGFRIIWTKPGQDKRCEFVAEHSGLGERIAVEAKSRRREDVLHEPVAGKPSKDFDVEIARLIRDAEEQLPTDIAGIVCIDLNLPPEHAMFTSDAGLVESLKSVLDRFPDPTPEKPSVLTATFFTNFAWHYQEGRRSGKSSVGAVIPRYARVAVRRGASLALLDKALHEHADVPNVNPTPNEMASLKRS